MRNLRNHGLFNKIKIFNGDTNMKFKNFVSLDKAFKFIKIFII